MLREASIDDVHAIEDLQRASREADLWVGRKLVEEFDNHVASITVAVPEQSDSSSILAMALVWHIAGETQLLELCVGKAARKQGIAAALLKHVWEAGSRGQMTLEVRASNIPAVSLYKKIGFETVGRRKGYYSDGEDALLMNLEPQNILWGEIVPR
mmetsp:Transcript_14050/g.36085  ORF Transcript_14050/g.36085 Transcript_14050/m.36085 type:complete len:156 (+) Transcript_14050:499-966(+)